MKIYKLLQNKVTGYDTYDSAVVYAENEEQAKKIHPSNFNEWSDELNCWVFVYSNGGKSPDTNTGWANYLTDIEAEYLGEAKEGVKSGRICSSFNAG